MTAFAILIIVNILNTCSSQLENIFNIDKPDNKQTSIYIQDSGLSYFLEYNATYLNKTLRTYGNPGDQFKLISDISDSSYYTSFSLFKDNNIILPGIDYYINYTTDNNIITDYRYTIAEYDINRNNSYKLGCVNYLSQLISNKIILVDGYSQAKKIDSFNNFNFALINDTLRFIDFSDKGTIHYLDINLNLTRYFWIVKDHRYPCLTVWTESKLIIYNLTSTIQYYSTVDLSFYILRNVNIEKVDISANYLYIASEAGFFIFKQISKKWIFDKKIVLNLYTDISDFVILNNTIYLVFKEYGLRIYDKIYKNLTDFSFIHPYIDKLDHYYDKTSTINFVGLHVNNTRSNIFEFLIELIGIDEYNPKINKIYTSSVNRFNITNNFVNIDRNTFIYNNESKNLYVIKRYNNPKTTSAVYYIPLYNNIYPSQDMFKIYPVMFGDNTNIIFIPQTDLEVSKTLIVGNFIMPNTVLGCYIKDAGSYNISLIYSDRDTTYKNYVVRYNLSISITDNLLYIWVIIGIIGGCMVILVTLVLVLHNKKIGRKSKKPKKLNDNKVEMKNDIEINQI